MDDNARRQRMEATIRTYFDGCNESDGDKIRACFAPDAVHYFPAGSPFGAFVGVDAIVAGWADCVDRLGSVWTIDRIAIDTAQGEAVIEWTHFKPARGGYLRGDEWYRFDDDFRITEIRAYYACPTLEAVAVHELGAYDYAGQGYPMSPPAVTRRRS